MKKDDYKRAKILKCSNCGNESKLFKVEEANVNVFALCAKCGTAVKKWRIK